MSFEFIDFSKETHHPPPPIEIRVQCAELLKCGVDCGVKYLYKTDFKQPIIYFHIPKADFPVAEYR
jgi:hypothetical protein